MLSIVVVIQCRDFFMEYPWEKFSCRAFLLLAWKEANWMSSEYKRMSRV